MCRSWPPCKSPDNLGKYCCGVPCATPYERHVPAKKMSLCTCHLWHQCKVVHHNPLSFNMLIVAKNFENVQGRRADVARVRAAHECHLYTFVRFPFNMSCPEKCT